MLRLRAESQDAMSRIDHELAKTRSINKQLESIPPEFGSFSLNTWTNAEYSSYQIVFVPSNTDLSHLTWQTFSFEDLKRQVRVLEESPQNAMTLMHQSEAQDPDELFPVTTR